MNLKLDKNMKEFLEEFNLSEREIEIYLTLLRTGPNTIMNLSRETGIKRSTTHNNVEELIKKGLVSQTNYGERRMVIAEEPAKLTFLLEQKKFRVSKLESNLPAVIEQINKMVPDQHDSSDVEVKYYEGNNNVQVIYDMAFNAKELRSFVNLKATSQIFPENKEIYSKAIKDNKLLKVWEIVENDPDTIKLADKFAEMGNFEYKVTNEITNLQYVNTLIFDNKIALINLNEKITGTVTENAEFYSVMKNIFDMLWSRL